MGNYVSCTLPNSSILLRQNAQSKNPRVILWTTGDVISLPLSTTAAELMFDYPNNFLVSAKSMSVGRRFMPLSADEELELGEAYVLLPMKRVNSVVTEADLGVLLIVAKRASGRNTRISPEVSSVPEPEQSPRSKLLDDGDEMISEFRHRLSLSRSRKPQLETIVEENTAVAYR